MAIICGFNEFNQLDHFSDCPNSYIKMSLDKLEANIQKIVSLQSISGLRFSWNYCVNISDDSVYVSGFVGGKSNCKKKLIVPGQDKICQVTCSRKHCLVLTVTSQCWKYTLLNGEWTDLTPLFLTEKNTDANITHISCGVTQNIATTLSGWIYNIPSRISFLPEVIVKDIACGIEHSVLLSTVGQVFTWGLGSRGQLGHGDLEPEEQPKEIQSLTNVKVTNIAVGGWHTWVLTEDGELYSWGWNSNGQLACSLSECKVQTEPRAVKWLTEMDIDMETKVIKVACGSRHTVILLSNGFVYGCGWNFYCQLLLSKMTTDIDRITKLPLPNSIDIACGAWNTAVLIKNVETISLS